MSLFTKSTRVGTLDGDVRREWACEYHGKLVARNLSTEDARMVHHRVHGAPEGSCICGIVADG